MKEIRKDPIVDDFHGTKVADPYRWLEESTSKDTLKWVEERKREVDEYFSHSNTAHEDRERLEELWDYPKLGVPRKVKNRLFYMKNDGLQNQSVLYVKEEDQQEEVLIDPNLFSDDGTVAMTNYAISDDGNWIAYALSKHGSDWQEIFIRNVTTKEDQEDHIKHVKFTNIAWAPDHSGFFYSRFPDPDTVSKEDEGNYSKVYFHNLGTSQEKDILIYEQPENKELMFSPMISEDKKFLILHVSHGTAPENQVYIQRLKPETEVIKLLDQEDARYSYVANDGDHFYFQTNKNAPNGKLIQINLQQPEPKHWQDLIPETSDVLQSVTYINGKFITVYLHHAHHQIQIYDQSNTLKHTIELPVIGSVAGLTKNRDENEIYFGFTSFIHPPTIYHFTLDTYELTTFAETKTSLQPESFDVQQVFYPSKDGTKIPMFIIHKKDLPLKEEHPAILYGYGGFNISQTPSYSPARIRWLEKGGIFAIANLRGGGEYGAKWHEAGMLENKQNVFDDFIAAGEWLIKEKYTNRNKLAIMGGSNGGLLVAACMVQRPDLFGAVICQVPVIDMLRYHKFTIGHYWIPEYGNPERKEHFPFLYAYSPLHNIKEGEKYPPILLATAESDDRVVPAHAKKFAATLKEKASKQSKVLLRLEAKAGHGLGKPTTKVIEEWVDYFTFLDKELG